MAPRPPSTPPITTFSAPEVPEDEAAGALADAERLPVDDVPLEAPEPDDAEDAPDEAADETPAEEEAPGVASAAAAVKTLADS